MPSAPLTLAREQIEASITAMSADLVNRRSAVRAARFTGADVTPLQRAAFTSNGALTALRNAAAKTALIR